MLKARDYPHRSQSGRHSLPIIKILVADSEPLWVGISDFELVYRNHNENTTSTILRSAVHNITQPNAIVTLITGYTTSYTNHQTKSDIRKATQHVGCKA